MTTEAIGTLLLAAVAIAGSIGSVLMLAFRVGKLTGEVTARMNGADADVQQMWQAIGGLTDRVNRHTEQPHGKRPH